MSVAAKPPMLVYLRTRRNDPVASGVLVAESGAAAARVASPPSQEARAARDAGSSSSSSEERGAADTAKKVVKKKRKSTGAVRKEEAQRLVKKLRDMEEHVLTLHRRYGIPTREENEALREKQRENAAMDEVRHAQVLSLCGGHSLLSQHMRNQFSTPLKRFFRLGKDMGERRSALLALRGEKLEAAYRCIEEKFRGVNDRRPFVEDQSWTSAEGDFYFHRTDATQIEGARSVKQVFDALMHYFINMEISISEEMGQFTLREDIDAVDSCTSNYRLISSTDHDLTIEINAVNYSDYYESYKDHGGDEFALFCSDAVDVDELYPYCPRERVRKDVITAASISSYRKPTRHGQSELVVVLRRCSYFRIYKPAFEVSPAALEELYTSVSGWSNVMAKTIKDYISTRAGIVVIPP